ncbi:hypothetical protein I546_4703 [Mycobacterium kansasii 732]|nr:hypothetical protein I546_4703 [Mycobacterium kansasii 732]
MSSHGDCVLAACRWVFQNFPINHSDQLRVTCIVPPARRFAAVPYRLGPAAVAGHSVEAGCCGVRRH